MEITLNTFSSLANVTTETKILKAYETYSSENIKGKQTKYIIWTESQVISETINIKSKVEPEFCRQGNTEIKFNGTHVVANDFEGQITALGNFIGQPVIFTNLGSKDITITITYFDLN